MKKNEAIRMGPNPTRLVSFSGEFGHGLMHSGSTLVNMEMAPTSQGGSLGHTLTSASERTSPAAPRSWTSSLREKINVCDACYSVSNERIQHRHASKNPKCGSTTHLPPILSPRAAPRSLPTATPDHEKAPELGRHRDPAVTSGTSQVSLSFSPSLSPSPPH